MAWTYRYMSAAEVAKVKADAVKIALPFLPSATLLRAWEAELAAHEALRDSKVKAEDKKSHEDAIKALEKALTDALVLL